MYALMVHLTEMRFIISPKNNSGKNNIKANRAGYNCCVESALQNKGSHNVSPTKGKLYSCWWCLSGSRMAAEPAEGGVLLVLLRLEPRAGTGVVNCSVSDHCWALLSRCCTGCGCWEGGVDEILPFNKLVWHQQLSAHCRVWSIFPVPAAGVLFYRLLQCKD